MNNNTHHIQPTKEIKYDFTQSIYAVAPKVPFRPTIMGPGRSVLLTNMIIVFGCRPRNTSKKI